MNNTSEKTVVTKALLFLKEVGGSFAKTWKQKLDSGEIPPPKGYSVDEYKKIIDIAHEELIMRSAENSAKKRKIHAKATEKTRE